MSALRQPDFTTKYYSPKLQPQPVTQPYSEKHSKIIQPPEAKVNKLVKTRNFTQSQALPHNLKILLLLQKSSFAIALASLSVSLGLYISTVQIPKLWSQEYQNLENLQRQERQLIELNETIKYQTAQAASEDPDLSISTSESAVFIPPAQIIKQQDPETITASNQQQIIKLKHQNSGY